MKSEISKKAALGIKAVNHNLDHMLTVGYDTIIVTVASDLIPVWVIPAAAKFGIYCASLLVNLLSDHRLKKSAATSLDWSLSRVIHIGKGAAKRM